MDSISTFLCILILVVLGGMFFSVNKDNLELFSSSSQRFTMRNFDVYLINLNRNSDRLEFFIEQYIMSDLRYKQFQRITAVDGSSLEIKEYISDSAFKEITQIEKSGFRTKHYQLTRGAIGCYLSHMKAFELIANGDSEYGFIFEDDAIVDKTLLAKLNLVVPTMDDSWDILLIGCHCIVCDKYETYLDINKFFLMHSYIIKKQSAINILALLNSIKISQQIDSELSDLAAKGYLKIYCLKKNLSKQGGFETDIQMPLKVMPGINPYTTLI